MKNNAVLEVGLENLDIKIAARVAQLAVLEEIYLVDAKISRDPLTMSPKALTLEHKCSTEILSNDIERKIQLILCNFQVAAFNGKSLDKLVMKIEASFCTSYAWKLTDHIIPDDDDSPDTLIVGAESAETTLSALKYLLTINPISNAWPYWREFVQSMSARMGFPALTVPLLEIALKKATLKQAKSKPAKKEATRRKKANA
jgi:hypothetical protein